MITLEIPDSLGVVTTKDATKYCRDHVVISRKDLKKIAKLARKHKLYGELKKLGITTQDISVRR